MTIRKYSSRAQQTTLSSGITSGDLSMTVGSGANLMGGKTPAVGETYTAVIDPDTALEEIVDVSNYASGNTLTIARGIDGSTGVAHSAGAIVRHMVIGRDLTETNQHSENVTTAHGLTIANVVTTASSGVVTSAMITDGTIVNADVNASAAIAYSKLSLAGTITSSDITNDTILNADINTAAGIVATKIAGTAVTLADAGTVTSLMILDGTIVNADINASAAIDKTKISGTAVTVADTGTVTSAMILDGAILNADVNASAAIAWTKIAPSATVSAVELDYLDGVTSAIQAQIDAKLATTTAATTYAPITSPTLTGVPAAPTASGGTNTTQIATTAFVSTAVSNLVNGATAALDTLNELATALGNDANFAATTAASIATKLPLAGGTMSGAIAMGTSKITGLGTPTVSTDASTKAYADTMLPLAGGALSGALAMGTNKITGLGTPTLSTDASTKAYADIMLPLAGGTMSGAIAMGTSKITGLGTPTVSTDAATKAYADSIVASAPSNLTGPITSVGAATSIASQTGTGTKFVVDTSPTLVTPVLGVATATSINATAIPSTKTLVVTTDKLSVHAATTSAELAGVISDETGTGALVFANSPALVTPALGTPSAINLTNATGLPISTGVSGLATGVATLLATPSSANLAAAVTDETGSGALVFGTGPTLTRPIIDNASLGYATTATAAGTTTLTVASGYKQVFTGTTTQTVVLPVVSTLPALGFTYRVINDSTGIVTVQSSGANTVYAIPKGVTVDFICILLTGTTAASWLADYPAAAAATSGLTFLTGATFSSVASFSILANTFSATYLNYKLILVIENGTADSAVTLKFRTAGTDNSNASYYGAVSGVNDTGGVNGVFSAGTTSFGLGDIQATNNAPAIVMDIFNPFSTIRTDYAGYCVSAPSTAAGTFGAAVSGIFNAATSFDALSILLAAGTFSGHYKIYGYANS